MYNQSFSIKELYGCSTQAERRNSGLKKDAFMTAIENELGNSLIDGTYEFLIRQQNDLYLNGRKKSDFGYLCQNLVLRKLYNNIKRIYSVQQSDRNTIVKQMKILLNEDVNLWVVRLDIRQFYESVNRVEVLEKLKDDARLNYQSLTLLQILFDNPVISSGKGLPRGLGVSAAMSEIYLKYFDLAVKRIEGVYYYARYVDDIIVFCNSEKSKDEVWRCAEKELSGIGLELNPEKSYFWSTKHTNHELTYLGYTFKKHGSMLNVTIARKKLNVIKTRITLSFVRYSEDQDFEMLKNRIKFLTGNFTLYQTDTLTPIKVGIHFNYKQATDIKALDDLDKYYQRILHCRRGRLGAVIALSKAHIKDLERYSFRFGYEKHVNHFFSVDQLIKITNCWK
jgi:hypothetical protein